MKLLTSAFIVILSLLTNTVAAEDRWFLLIDEPHLYVYLDTSSIRMSDNNVLAWSKTILKNPINRENSESWNEARKLMEIDCVTGAYTEIQLFAYHKDGSVHQERTREGWMLSIPGTTSGMVNRKICDYVRESKGEVQ